MEIVNNMMRTILISIVIIIITGASIATCAPTWDHLIEEKNIQPIVCYINFTRHVEIEVSLSDRQTQDELISEYFVFDYTEYADTFEEFEKKYPNFTLHTYYEVGLKSASEYKAHGEFHELNNRTSFFIADENGYYVDIADGNGSIGSAYELSLHIKIGFVKRGTRLFLRPYMTGKNVSPVDTKISLTIDFEINTITFNPKIRRQIKASTLI